MSVSTTAGQMAHDAFVYSSDADFLEGLVPFVKDGLRGGEPVSVVTGARNAELLERALGPAAKRVSFVDAREWYRRPVRTIAAYRRMLDHQVGDGAERVRVVGEVQFGTTPRDHAEWTRYEAVLNRAFHELPAWIVCPYDSRVLPDHVVDHAPRTHPALFDGDRRRPSAVYEPPDSVLAAVQTPLDVPMRAPDVEVSVGEGLGSIRDVVRELVARIGASTERVEALLVALNEVTTNAALYAGGGRVRMWRDGRVVVCEVVDSGPGITDPFAGYVPPHPESDGGRGLWLVRQLVDAVELAPAAPEGGLAVRMESVL